MALRTPDRGVYKVADQFGGRPVPEEVRQNRLDDAQQILTVLGNGPKQPARGPIAQKWGNLRRHRELKRSRRDDLPEFSRRLVLAGGPEASASPIRRHRRAATGRLFANPVPRGAKPVILLAAGIAALRGELRPLTSGFGASSPSR